MRPASVELRLCTETSEFMSQSKIPSLQAVCFFELILFVLEKVTNPENWHQGSVTDAVSKSAMWFCCLSG